MIYRYRADGLRDDWFVPDAQHIVISTSVEFLPSPTQSCTLHTSYGNSHFPTVPITMSHSAKPPWRRPHVAQWCRNLQYLTKYDVMPLHALICASPSVLMLHISWPECLTQPQVSVSVSRASVSNVVLAAIRERLLGPENVSWKLVILLYVAKYI